jgi:hypothetical protein
MKTLTPEQIMDLKPCDDDIGRQQIDVIIARAVTNYALHCGVNKVEKWAKNWLSGVDRTANSARSAANYACACTDVKTTAANAVCSAADAASKASEILNYEEKLDNLLSSVSLDDWTREEDDN